jgi:hypothetical protein
MSKSNEDHSDAWELVGKVFVFITVVILEAVVDMLNKKK